MCFIPEHTAFLTQKLKHALTDRLPCLWVKLDGSLLPWKEFPTRLSPKLGDGVLDRPWEQVGTVHSLRTTKCHDIERSEELFTGSLSIEVGLFLSFLGDRKAGSATPGGISTAHRYPPAPPGWVTRPCATRSLYLTQRGFFQSRASITPFAHRSVRARCSSYWNVFTCLCLSFSTVVVIYSSQVIPNVLE